MSYNNRFQRANRGLIVFLIDQSASMSQTWSNGLTLADNVAYSINLTLNDIIVRLTDGTTGDVKNTATIAAIGYGGKDDYNAETLFCETISEIDEKYPKAPTTIATKEGNSTIDCIQVVKSVSNYGTPMASAFKMAKEVVEAWINTHNGTQDPVPVVINISEGAPTDSESDVKKYANEILNLSIPDGNVLVFNIHISSSASGQEVKFPADGQTMPDEMSKLLYDISSKVSKDLINQNYQLQSKNIQPGSRLFMSNVNKAEELSNFLDAWFHDDKIYKIK
jgi:hypothetical protein